MSSLKYNITRKMEYMGRRLRHIDAAGEIKEWVGAMTALNSLLKDLNIKSCTDNWRPWKSTKEVGNDELRKPMTGRVPEKIERRSNTGRVTEKIKMRDITGLAKGRPPRVQVKGDDVGMFDPKAAVMKMLKQPQKEDYQRKLEGILSKMDEDNEDMENTEDEAERREVMKEAKEHIEKALVQRLKAKGTDINYWLEVDIDKERLTRMIRYIEKDVGMAEGELNEIGQWIADMTKLICTKMQLNELESN